MQIGALIAFLSYLVQILMAVMMATFIAVLAPRAVGVRRAHQGGARHPVVGRRRRRPRSPRSATAGSLELRDVGFHYPGADAPVLTDISLRATAGQTTAIIGSTGAGKTTLLNLIPRLFDATVGHRARRRRRRPRARPRDAVEPHRPRAPEAVPVLRHGGEQPALRRSRRHRRRAVGGARDRPGHRLRARRCPAGSTRRSPRAAPTCRAGSASAWPSPGRWCAARRSTCSTTRSRRSTSPPTPGSAPRWRRYTADATVVIVAQRVSTIINADQILVLEDGRVVGLGTHRELLETCPTYAEIVASQLTRGGGGMSRRPTAEERRLEPRSQPTRSPIRPPERAGAPRLRWRMGAAGMPLEKSEGLRRTRPGGCSRTPAPGAARASPGRARRSRVASVTLTVLGPRILGHATNIIVDGVTSATNGIDFDQLRNVAARRCSALYVASAGAVLPAVVHARRRRAADDVPAARPTSRTSSTACRSRYVDRQPRGDLLSRVTNDIDNVAQSLQQTLSQMLTSTLTHRRRR